jgi:hypothetical protein
MDPDENELGYIYYSYGPYFLVFLYLVAGVPGNDFPTVPEELNHKLEGHLNCY